MQVHEHPIDVEVAVEVFDLERDGPRWVVAAREEVRDHAIHDLVTFFTPEIVGWTRLDLAALGDERLLPLELLVQ